MKETGVLFTKAMRQAKREGKKTQSRRVMNPQPEHKPFRLHPGIIGNWFHGVNMSSGVFIGHPDMRARYVKKYSPWGWIGDRIYVKEPHYLYGGWDHNGVTKSGKPSYRFVHIRGEAKFPENPPKRICTSREETGWFLRNSLFMPKWCARDWATIAEVRVKEIQDISDGNCITEGVIISMEYPFENGELPCPWCKGTGLHNAFGGDYGVIEVSCCHCDTVKKRFEILWDSINGKPRKDGVDLSWKANPWVWAYTWKND